VIEERRIAAIPGGALALVLHRPESDAPVPCVVACHGLNASKDSDKYLLLGVEVPAAGLALARFDFRGCGESTGVEEETTVSTRIEDARAVLAHLRGDPRLDGRFGLLGSSMGGFVALHVAAARADGMPVVTWNAPANLDDLAARAARGAPGVGPAIEAEYRTRRYAETPAGVPCHLVVQGEADDVVPPAHGRTLFDRAHEPRELVVVPGGDHRLTEPAHRKDALARSIAWFLRFLGPRA